MTCYLRCMSSLAQLPGPFDPRPGRPFFLPAVCPEPGCEQQLVLDDELDDIPLRERWHDEWVCPAHRETIHYDVPVPLS